MSSSPTTSRASVVLRCAEDWDEWMLVINTMARRGAVQGLVDVESSVELEEPTRPILPIYSTVTAEAVSMKDLDNNEQKECRRAQACVK